jgi:hypothetical protein
MVDAYMGYAVAGGGDLDGDGFGDVAAGANNLKFDPDTRGGVFVFGGSASGVQTTPIFTKQDNVPNLNGYSIAVAGNMDGAGGLHLAVGAPNYGGGVYEDGSVSIYSGEPGTLPVTLNQFNARLLNSGVVEITWDTYSEQMNSHFEVLRSTDGIQYSFLGRRNGQLNSNAPTAYKLMDNAPQQGNNFYRLVQYDVDGKSKILGTKIVKVNAVNVDVAVYPNPTVGVVNVRLRGQGYKKVDLVDVSGRVFYTRTLQGADVFDFDLSGMAKGVYLIRVYGNDGKVVNRQVVKN